MLIIRACLCLVFLLSINFKSSEILKYKKCQLSAMRYGLKNSLQLHLSKRTMSLQKNCNGIVSTTKSRKVLRVNYKNTLLYKMNLKK